MRVDYQLTNVWGSVFRQGNVVFTPDGNCVLAPVGNRVILYDLIRAKNVTLPFEMERDIRRIAVSPDGTHMAAVDKGHMVVLFNLQRRVVVGNNKMFGSKCTAIKFNPTGRYLAVLVDGALAVFRTPDLSGLDGSFDAQKLLQPGKEAIKVELPSVKADESAKRARLDEEGKEKKSDSSSSSNQQESIQDAETREAQEAEREAERSSFFGFQLETVYREHVASRGACCLDWSPDSKSIIIGTKDYSVVVVYPGTKYRSILSGHKKSVLGVFFDTTGDFIYTVCADKHVRIWRNKEMLKFDDEESIMDDIGVKPEEEESEDDEDGVKVKKEKQAKKTKKVPKRFENPENWDPTKLLGKKEEEVVKAWQLDARHTVALTGTLQSVAMHKTKPMFPGDPGSGLLVLGTSTGDFSIYELPSCDRVHSLHISSSKVTTAAINSSGEWLAFGCAPASQLLVWEWKSETYIIKQQGHLGGSVSAHTFSQDGRWVATGGDDGKIKLWESGGGSSVASGNCFVTFSDHTGTITGMAHSGANPHSLYTSSRDGTVRAFDVSRYRNFRTYTAPGDESVQFTCVAVDPAAEVVAAGTDMSFEIYLWNAQTADLIEKLSGHEGPISSMAFSPSTGTLATGSWDNTVKLWEVYASSKNRVESLQHTAEVLAVAYRPDGKQLAVSTRDGIITLWDPATSAQQGSIDVKRDMLTGTRVDSRFRAEKNANTKYATNIAFSADGRFLIAGGISKHVCLYSISPTGGVPSHASVLVRKFQICKNIDVPGVVEHIPKHEITEAGHKSLLVRDGYDSDEDAKAKDYLPGVLRGDLRANKMKMEARTRWLQFSPTSREFGVATEEGLQIYSLDSALAGGYVDEGAFDPIDLDIDLTPHTVLTALSEGRYGAAFVMAMRLNEAEISRRVFESIPPSDILTVVQSIPLTYLERVINFLVRAMEQSVHLEFVLHWCTHIFNTHGRHMMLAASRQTYVSALRNLQRAMLLYHSDISKLASSNDATLDYMCTILSSGLKPEAEERQKRDEKNTGGDFLGVRGKAKMLDSKK